MLVFLLYLLSGFLLVLLILYLLSLRTVYSIEGKHVLVSQQEESKSCGKFD